ncbi:bifunctional adenosylcobinamide kinase/adenosylcobinamide-phosphate guanylyltransferase [Ancylobacter dichloromethanicus]|uniref:Bifunctional adenosylcobalamin biosynthesis protein n=1 Tax=Ancylobacter dichloromethanicus TaxID=518825 RepID=A0A9W6MZF7_9HYPH|nr:bifunctional adenosylcobinamide kinase/adenosylcobinamide-phosphate guanylyltransferase [Ancylobacter dichloromethanicus]MBS7553606.1 bifunctional adenosylcobinamide kinase/adenosylcobinamide-phosphate guanylyltransferase [Ancylobacter dichloromethanicus]GLK72669.1 adenosylcobinamide kinase/adenosylcobinamide phosphate guanyltransferase [Ancylobacter dichloromethanicus]
MSPSLTFVLGGARSGKSAHAEAIVARLAPPWIYIATADAWDDEMAERIALHRARRGAGWQTRDAPHDLAGALGGLPPGQPVLVDCLTLWLSNRLLAGADVAAESAALVEALAAHDGPVVAVSNEVGLGIVPDNALARRFRDAQGRLNQMVAARAGTVLFMVAGLPMLVKGSPP